MEDIKTTNEKIEKEQKFADMFIKIAAGGKKMDCEVPRLNEIKPCKIKKVEIKKSNLEEINYPVFNEDEAYKNFLKEKEELKNKIRPFMKKYSSNVNTPLTKTSLVDFLYRKETDCDKEDFSNVLNKKGEFEKVKIPHYVGPEGRWNAFYVKDLFFEEINEENEYVLDFEAVDYSCEVFINGRLCATHTGFFAPFKADITPYIHKGENTLVIVVKNNFTTTGTSYNGFTHYGDKIYAATSFGYDEPILGWHHCPAGAGIVGKVDLVVSKKQRIVDIFVRPDIDNGKITVNTTVFNYLLGHTNIKIFYTIEGRNFKETLFSNVEGKANTLCADTNYFTAEFKLDNFKLWTLDAPYLYDVKITITDLEGNIIDEEQTHFGMRKFYMDENSKPYKGAFYFNNERIMLRGTNEMGHLPRAVMEDNDEQLLDDICIAKVANLNYYRMTQRPVFKKIYDYFDMTGMLCQNDFPLFSYIKDSVLGEALKQIDEMERLVRNHPSVIIDTFCNETLDKTAWGFEQYNLSRYDIEKFFNSAKELVLLLNPDRVIKYNEGDYAPLENTYGISDFHTYTFWYVSHGLPSGKMNKGYLPPLRHDWMVGCGEYGADGLDRYELMRKYCPKEWLPKSDDEPWSPKPIAREQCYVLHGAFFPEENYIHDWIRVSREHQVFATKELTHILRRRADYIESTAIHLLIDCWPCGWTKTLVDVDRIPKPAYYAYKDALIPLRVSLRRDKYTVYSGDTVETEVYCLNDYPNNKDFSVKINILANGKLVETRKINTLAKPVSSNYIGSVSYKPSKDFVGTIEMVAEANGVEITFDKVVYKVLPKIKKAEKTPIINSKYWEPIKKLCNSPIDTTTQFVDVDYYEKHKEELEKFAYDGGRLIVYTNRPLTILNDKIVFRVHTLEEEVAANNLIYSSRTHKFTSEFDVMDFKNFYNHLVDYQDLSAWFKFQWPQSKEILYTLLNTNEEEYALHKRHNMVMAEKDYGKGKVYLTTLSCVEGCANYNPILDKFLVNLING